MYRLDKFKKDGELFQGENVERQSEKMKQIEKSTKIEFSLPN